MRGVAAAGIGGADEMGFSKHITFDWAVVVCWVVFGLE